MCPPFGGQVLFTGLLRYTRNDNGTRKLVFVSPADSRPALRLDSLRTEPKQYPVDNVA